MPSAHIEYCQSSSYDNSLKEVIITRGTVRPTAFGPAVRQ